MKIKTDCGEHEVFMMCPHCGMMLKEIPSKDYKCTRCNMPASEFVDIDAGIADIVNLINSSQNVRTVFCCEGHYKSEYEKTLPYVSFQLKGVHGFYRDISFNKVFDPYYLPRLGEISLDWDWLGVVNLSKPFEREVYRFMYSKPDPEAEVPYPIVNIRMTNTLTSENEDWDEVFPRRRIAFLDQLERYARYLAKNV
jgi:hypothetical protein